MNYQWYPGHMTKAVRQMQEDVKLIDLIIELIDARVPYSSKNPDIDVIGQNKSRILLMNKSDLADPTVNSAWKKHYGDKGYMVLDTDARNKMTLKGIMDLAREACREKIERDRRRGIKNRPIRAMVVGIPNVGKSTFINSFASKACAKTGNKPGVTKGKQWIRLSKELELLDTPGILWPKFENNTVGERLAMIGSINDDILNKDELAMSLLKYLLDNYCAAVEDRYGIVYKDEEMPKVLEMIAVSRGYLQKGSEIDYSKASNAIIDDFRSGKLGRITLDRIEEIQ